MKIIFPDWRGQLSPNKAGVYNFNYSVPRSPINCTTPLYVDNQTTPIYNHIGYTISGVQLYGPLDADDVDALIYEGWSLDNCGGHVTYINGGRIAIDYAFPFVNYPYVWSADYPTGGYHCKQKLKYTCMSN